MPAAPTPAELHRWARARLAHSGNAGGDADALLCAGTGRNTAAIIAGAAKPVPPRQAARFRKLVARRARGEPLAYLLGEREFWSLRLAVTPDVLIPRIETELLVECALAHAARREVAAILELGTGSGAVALALAGELRCDITATDIAGAALQVASRNRRRHRATRVELRRGDWFDAAPPRRFDLIVSNPPYVAPHDRHLREGDLRFEPKSALVAQCNGFAEIAKIIRAAPHYLRGGGMLLLEHGCTQAATVRELLAERGFGGIATRRDLGGRERVSGGVWRGRAFFGAVGVAK
ncbi:MAG: peptide chain release factor N(5)-glutamine methyltransferase [Gammaproteobacteria bacterium]